MRAGGTDQPGADQEEGGEGEAGPGQAHPFNYPPHLLHKRIGVVACLNKNDFSFYLGEIVAGTKLKGLHVLYIPLWLTTMLRAGGKRCWPAAGVSGLLQ